MAQRNVDMEKMCVCSAHPTQPGTLCSPFNAGTFIFNDSLDRFSTAPKSIMQIFINAADSTGSN